MKRLLRVTIALASPRDRRGPGVPFAAWSSTRPSTWSSPSFGRIVAVYGDQADEAGLHVKLPWQAAIPIDRRLRVFDPPRREVLTGDKRNLEVASYVVWRVAEPVRFLRSAATLDAAEARLGERVRGRPEQRDRPPRAGGPGVDRPGAGSSTTTDQRRAAAVGPQASAELGLEVLDVRLRRFTPPIEVRPAVFDLDPQRAASRSRRRSAPRGGGIPDAHQPGRRGRATRLLAQADAEAERIRGQAQAEATRMSNEAHARDPKFAEFLRTLEAVSRDPRRQGDRGPLASSPLLKLLGRGPGDDSVPEVPKDAKTAASPRTEKRGANP